MRSERRNTETGTGLSITLQSQATTPV